MSLNGLTSYNPLTINGLDTLNIGGDPFDPASYVPYLGATQDVYLQGPVKMFQDYNATSTDLTVVVNRQTLNSAITAARTSLLSSNNTFTGLNDFTTQTTVESLKINSTGAPLQYTLTANAFGQLEIGYVGGPYFIKTNGSDIFNNGDINAGGTVSSIDAQLSGSQYFARTSPDEWSISVGSGGEYEIKDNTGTIRLKLSKTAGLTIGNLIANTARFTSITSATPTLALGVDGSGNLNTFPVPPTPINLLPLNNTWTGTNTFNNTVSTLSTTTVSSKAFLTQSLRIAGMTTQASQPGTITGGAPWLMTPNPTNSPFASCFSPTQTWVTGARYIFRFTNFTYAIFGMSLTILQANVANTAANQISATFPFVPGDFTGQFTPNSNPGFLGQVYLQFQGTANKTFNWTSFTYEVGTLEVDGVLEMTGIANISAGSPSAVSNNYMASGSLTIGDVSRNYGGGTTTWNSNTAGLMMECLDNTEIAVHDAGLRVASLMYYDGPSNTIRMGRDMGWGVSNVSMNGILTVGNIGSATVYLATDDRTIAPSEIPAGSLRFYFASYPNNGGTEYADCIGFNTYIDVSGGNSNLLMLRKNSIGLRIYQGAFGSGTAFSTYRDAVLANNNGDVEASGFIINGGGAYVPGCIYTDSNWGMLFRARVPGNAGAFLFNNSIGTQLLRIDDNGNVNVLNGQLLLSRTADGPGFVHTNAGITVETWIGGGGGWYGTRTNHPLRFYTNNSSTRMTVNTDGTVNIPLRLAIGGVNSSGVLDIVNPNGNYTHFGWTDNNNYIRGANSIFDCPITMGNPPSGLPRIQSPNNLRALIFDDGNGIQYLQNISGATPIAWNPGSWASGGGGYTIVSRAQGTSIQGLGMGVSDGRSVIISLRPGIAWSELILSGSDVYISNFGTLSLRASGGNWVFISDRRTKRCIKPIKTTRSLERIMALRPVTYKKIYHEERSETPIPQEVIDKDHIGLIAQDVQEVNPHCVSEFSDEKCVDGDDGKRLGVAYGDINIHLIGAIQELKKQNDAQQKEIETLTQRNEVLEAHARKLEEDFVAYQKLTNERFDKIALLFDSKK